MILPCISPHLLPRDPHLGLISQPATRPLASVEASTLLSFPVIVSLSPEASHKPSWAQPRGKRHLAIMGQGGSPSFPHTAWSRCRKREHLYFHRGLLETQFPCSLGKSRTVSRRFCFRLRSEPLYDSRFFSGESRRWRCDNRTVMVCPLEKARL